MGMVFDIKRFAIHDGPGIRTTVFLKGCPLNCWLCHNPESQALEREIMFREARCLRCGDCLEVCTEEARTITNGGIEIDGTKCLRCGTCMDACFADVGEFIGREMTVQEVMEEIERDRVFYDESGGGATFSGGEPLLQPEFIFTLLKACREMGIHTALDTSGFAPLEIMEKISGAVDLILYDLKLMNDEKHRKFTGVSNKKILANLKFLSSRGQPVLVRLPLLPGINDDEENLNRTGEFLASLDNPYPIDLLTFHQGGLEKYKRLKRENQPSRMEKPSERAKEEAAQTLQRFGLKVTLGGETLGNE